MANVIDAAVVAQENDIGPTLDAMAEFGTGGRYCCRGANFSDSSVPSAVALQHRLTYFAGSLPGCHICSCVARYADTSNGRGWADESEGERKGDAKWERDRVRSSEERDSSASIARKAPKKSQGMRNSRFDELSVISVVKASIFCYWSVFMIASVASSFSES